MCSYLICLFLTLKQCILGWLLQLSVKMLGSRDLLFRINFTFHSSRGAGILPRSGHMHLRGKCSCLYSSWGNDELFFFFFEKLYLVMQGWQNIQSRERGENRWGVRSLAANTELCVVPAGMQGLECALSWGCCFHGQLEYAEVQAGLAQAKQ